VTKKPEAVIFLSACDFPNGLAAPYRIRMFAKSFGHLGYQPMCVFQYAPGVAMPGQNRDIAGEFDGVRFCYPIGTLEPPKSFARMLYYKTWGLYKVLSEVRRLQQEYEIKFLFAYGTTGLEDHFYQRLARKVGAAFIVEVCDAPEVALFGGNRGLVSSVKRRLVHALLELKEWYIARADHVFVISQSLYRHYERSVGRSRLVLTPILADGSRFHPARRAWTQPSRLVWTGNFRRDQGLELLIEAAGHLRQRGASFTCDVYGATPKHQDYVNALQEQIDARSLGDVVKLQPAVPNDQIPALLTGADILLLPKEDNEVNRANFPTKLVDYLMAGRPVVASRVGEIIDYLEDGQTVIYPEANTAESFAAAVHQAMQRQDWSETIGANGRAYALRNFDYREVSVRIAEACGPNLRPATLVGQAVVATAAGR
jgi:glycosyltransferase involved in cell wall biosynthesis